MPRLPSPGRSRPTVADVAARAGVSTATVSRVLAQDGGATPAVKERVRAAARELGYRPNLSARTLRVRQRKVIGLVLPDMHNPFFTGVAHGVEETLCAAGYTLLLGNSADDAGRERRHLEVFHDEDVAGLVLVPCNAEGADYAPLAEWNVPMVAIDRTPGGIHVDFVNTDNQQSAHDAAAHLLRAGHRSLALINGPERLEVCRARKRGVIEAMREAGRAAEDLVVINADFRAPGGAAAMQALLDRKPKPRAVLITNNLMTLGALEVVHARGVRVPEDLALVSFDDVPWAHALHPPLTAVAQPAIELGRTAASLLLERIGDPSRPPRTVTLSNRLNIRGSCGVKSPSTA